MSAGPKSSKLRSPEQLGPKDIIGEGDSRIVYANAGPETRLESDSTSSPATDVPDFFDLKNEIHWQKMYHASGEVPRLVCCQGQYEPDYSMPLYRHPSDQSLPLLHYSPLVKSLSEQVARIVGHPVNHCLIQLYRGGQDFISEHSDKTLDIVRGSSIVNVSLGAERTMRLRTKKARAREGEVRTTQHIPMPHGSIFVLGPRTNMVWLHGINHDKRPEAQRSEEEKAFGGERISLTFRHIGTFLDSHQSIIWGQGARSKTQEKAGRVVSGDESRTKDLIMAFGMENQSSDFDWDAVYGVGFDVLDFTLGPLEDEPMVFYSGDWIADMRVRLYLGNRKGRGLTRQEVGVPYQPMICYRDNDEAHTQIYGDLAILSYLHSDLIYETNEDQRPFLSRLQQEASLMARFKKDFSKRSDRNEKLLRQFEFRLETCKRVTEGPEWVPVCLYWPPICRLIEDGDPAWQPELYPHVNAEHAKMLGIPWIAEALSEYFA